jgi:hypothetical protein
MNNSNYKNISDTYRFFLLIIIMKIHKLRHTPALSFINRVFSAGRYHRMALFPENPMCISIFLGLKS